MMNTKVTTKKLAFFQRAKKDGKRFAIHEPQLVMRPVAVTFDKGETWKELNLPAVSPGRQMRIEAPEDARECCVRVQVLGSGKSSEIAPIAITEFKRESEPHPEPCQLVSPSSTHVFYVRPEFVGRITKMKVACRPQCVLCGGVGFLGVDAKLSAQKRMLGEDLSTKSSIECPRCKSDGYYLENEFRDLLVNEIRIGTNGIFTGIEPVPARYFDDASFVDRAFYPGQFITLSVSNPLSVPVLVGGEFECEALEEPPYPPST